MNRSADLPKICETFLQALSAHTGIPLSEDYYRRKVRKKVDISSWVVLTLICIMRFLDLNTFSINRPTCCHVIDVQRNQFLLLARVCESMIRWTYALCESIAYVPSWRMKSLNSWWLLISNNHHSWPWLDRRLVSMRSFDGPPIGVQFAVLVRYALTCFNHFPSTHRLATPYLFEIPCDTL